MHSSGQVLVFHDLLGMFDKFVPKFSKQFANLSEPMHTGMTSYVQDVKNGSFPHPETHSFTLDDSTTRDIQRSLSGNVTQKRTMHHMRRTDDAADPLRVMVIGGGAMGTLYASRLAMLPPSRVSVSMVTSWQDQLTSVRSKGIELLTMGERQERHHVQLHNVIHGLDAQQYVFMC